MAKKKTTKSKLKAWFMLGILSIVLGAPNATVIKMGMGSIEPFLFNATRFSLIALCTVPFLLYSSRKITAKNIRYATYVGIYMLIAVLTFVWAIKLSQASYVAVMTLLTPIAFVILSAKLTGERIGKRAILGITIAAIGAFIIVTLPIALAQDAEFQFYPVATALILCNSISFPLAIIYSKKANQAGLPVISILSISSLIISTSCWFGAFLVGISIAEVTEKASIIPILYSGIVVALIARGLSILSYEHIGSAVSSALTYGEILLAIIIPVIFLHETLSLEIVVGGVLILLGVYITEHHQSKHAKHFQLFKHH